MKKILVGGFLGINNTAQILLDYWPSIDKLYLENDFSYSVKQLLDLISFDSFDLIILFGQKPMIKKLYLEKNARAENNILTTNFDLSGMKDYFEKLDYKVKISFDAGNYLCNNIYFNCLKYIESKNLKAKAFFIHLPVKKNCFDLKSFSRHLIEFLKEK